MIPHVESKNELEEAELQYGKDETKHIKWYHRVLLNRTLKVTISLVLVAVLVPILLYQFVFFANYNLTSPDGYSLGSCLVPRTSRLLCGNGNVTASECHQQCCYDHQFNLCFHRFPSRFSYILDRLWTEEVLLKPRVATVPYNSTNSLTNIRLSLNEVSSSHLTVTFYNSANFSLTGQRIDEKDYVYNIDSPELNVVVNSTQGTIFTTMRGPLIASENIWEVALKLTEETMYGFGEIPIKVGTKMIYNHRGGLSSIPLIYAKINDSYHGLLIDTVDPTEITFMEDNAIVIRSITNFGLKFQVFVGPKPADVMEDVMKFVGFKKGIEYWMLGAHVCSEYSNEENSMSINDFIQEAITQNMPFESHCVKPIVFDDVCETASVTNINDGATMLKNAGKKFIPHVSPYILYEEIDTVTTTEPTTTEPEVQTREQNRYCKYNIEDYTNFMLQNPEQIGMYKGLVGDDQVIYPDYSNTSDELIENLWIYTKDVDGLVLENTWPLDESQKFVNETNQMLPYFSENFESAFNHTPQWNATESNGEKYFYKHNEYGNRFSNALGKIKSVPIGTPSQWLNGNVYISRQNVTTSWTDLQKELVEAALGGVSGHWHWSSPICGDTDNFDSEIHTSLCVKWYLAATYFPMIKIHSRESGRDPLSFTGTYRSLMIDALRNRLSLAPYFYTTLQEGPLLRPMFYQFPKSEFLKDLISQFSVGNSLLIVPNLQPRQSMVHVIMPPGIWYEFWSGLKIEANEGQAVTMATTDADFLTLIQGGSIVVLQKDVKLTAEETRSQSSFSLTIALKCITLNNTREDQTNSTKCTASGTIHMAANTTIHLEADNETLRITGEGDYSVFCSSPSLWWRMISNMNIYGLENSVNNYDHMKHVATSINLCDLQTEPKIVFDFINVTTS